MVKNAIEKKIIEVAGKRCRTFEPGCACCDMWEMYDLGAWGALLAEFVELDEFMADWNAMDPTKWEKANLPNDVVFEEIPDPDITIEMKREIAARVFNKACDLRIEQIIADSGVSPAVAKRVEQAVGYKWWKDDDDPNGFDGPTGAN